MLARYRLIQFVPDMLFPSPVSVGVLAWAGGEVHLRMIGLGERADLAPRTGAYERAFGIEHGASPAFREWLDWFCALSARTGEFLEGSAGILDELHAAGAPFVADEEGEADIPESDTATFADDIFRRAVFANEGVRRAVLEDRAELCLEGAGVLAAGQPTEPDAEVELVSRRSLGPGLLHFTWFHDGERRTGYKVIDFSGDDLSVGKQVAEAMSTFQVATNRKVLDREGCVVLHDGEAANHSQYVQWLMTVSTLVDVGADDAILRLRKIAFG